MKQLLVLLFLILLQACGGDPNFLDQSRKDQSILQGISVNRSNLLSKSVVLITQDLTFLKNEPSFFGLCTGVVISTRVILTAAHCLTNDSSHMKIILNPAPRENFSLTNDVYNVIDSIVHESYKIKKMNQPYSNSKPDHFLQASVEDFKSEVDLALISVDRDLPETEYFTNEYLSDLDLKPSQIATIAGFGKTTPIKDTSQLDYKIINGNLKKAEIELKIQDPQQSHFIVEQWEKSGVCKGDSGGPLFINQNGQYRLLGLAIGVLAKENKIFTVTGNSNNYDCSGYGVYLNIEILKPWIKKKIYFLENKSH